MTNETQKDSTDASTAKLRGKQARHLRALGHHLQPVIFVGKEGVTESLIRSTDEVITVRELIKVKLQQNSPVAKEEAAEHLARATNSAVAQIIGRTILLYRENPDLPAETKIKLP